MKTKLPSPLPSASTPLISDEGERPSGSGQLCERPDPGHHAHRRVSAVDAAVLAAANIADNYFKEMEAGGGCAPSAEGGSGRVRPDQADLSEAKREIFRLSSAKK